MKTEFVPPIRYTVMLPVPVERAFALFTEELTTWWPPEYTWSQDVLEAIVIEPCVGGRCYERGPHGFMCDWGRVLIWDNAHRLVFTWQISPKREPQPDAEKASEIEVHFEREGGDKTRVELEHREFARHGEGAKEYRAALASQEGWGYILECYVAAAAGVSSSQ